MFDINNNILQNKKYIFKIDYISGGESRGQKKKKKNKNQGNNENQDVQELKKKKADAQERNDQEEIAKIEEQLTSIKEEKQKKREEEQRLREEQNRLKQEEEDRKRRLEHIHLDNIKDDKKYIVKAQVNKVNIPITHSHPDFLQQNFNISRDESFIFEDNISQTDYRLNKIHFYKNKFCKFNLFKNLSEKYNQFKASILYFNRYKILPINIKSILEKYSDYHNNITDTNTFKQKQRIDKGLTEDTFNYDSNYTYYRIKTLEESNINDINDIYWDKKRKTKNLFSNYFSKLNENQYCFYLNILQYITNDSKYQTQKKYLDENISFVKTIYDNIKTYEGTQPITNDINDVFSIIKFFESIIFFYESVKDINDFYKLDKKKLLMDLEKNINDQNFYDNLKNNFEENEFKEISNKISQDLNDKKNIIKEKFNKLYNYNYIYHITTFKQDDIKQLNDPDLIQKIKKFPKQYIIYKTVAKDSIGNTVYDSNRKKKCDLNLAQIRTTSTDDDIKKEQTHFLKYSIYKSLFYLNQNNEIKYKTDENNNEIFLEFDKDNGTFIINDNFSNYYPLYEISNTGCYNNNFYLHYFNGQFRSISFHFNIFLNNYRFHLKIWDGNVSFSQNKIKIDEQNEDLLFSRNIQYSANKAKMALTGNLNFKKLNDLNNNDMDIGILKIFQEIMFKKEPNEYKFGNIYYNFGFDKKLIYDGKEYRFIKYPDNSKYYLSEIYNYNNLLFDFLENKTNY